MDDSKVRKLREKLGISAADQTEKMIGSNLRRKISGYPGMGGNFVSAPSATDTAVAETDPRTGGNFVSAPSAADTAVAKAHPGTGGNFVSAPFVTDTAVAESRLT